MHGEEDTERQAGRSYLMLEGTDGQVHYIYYTPEMEEARSRGELRANSFVRLRKQFSEGHPAPKIEGPGDSDAILRNQAVSEKPCRASIGGGLPRERTDGTDGSGTTRRHFTRSRQLWNANALRNDSSSKRPKPWTVMRAFQLRCRLPRTYRVLRPLPEWATIRSETKSAHRRIARFTAKLPPLRICGHKPTWTKWPCLRLRPQTLRVCYLQPSGPSYQHTI